MKRVTVYDIAKELGMSPSTVSRVLNNSVLVGEESRARILDAAQRMGYRKRVIRKQSNRAIVNIRLYLPYMEDSFIHLFYDIAELLSGLRDGFGETRINIITELNDNFTGVFDNKKLGDIDGIVSAFTVPDPETAREIRSRDIPLVLLNREDETGNFIAYDSEGGMETLLSVAKEKRPDLRPCYLGFSPVPAVSEARRRGMVRGCGKLGVPFSESDVFTLHSMSGITADFLGELVERDYNAVFCFNDVMAVYLYYTASERGVSIPGRFSLTGFDKSPVRNLVSAGIDTIQLSTRRLGIEAGGWLRKRIIDRIDEPVRMKLNGEYVPGNTV